MISSRALLAVSLLGCMCLPGNRSLAQDISPNPVSEALWGQQVAYEPIAELEIPFGDLAVPPEVILTPQGGAASHSAGVGLAVPSPAAAAGVQSAAAGGLQNPQSAAAGGGMNARLGGMSRPELMMLQRQHQLQTDAAPLPAPKGSRMQPIPGSSDPGSRQFGPSADDDCPTCPKGPQKQRIGALMLSDQANAPPPLPANSTQQARDPLAIIETTKGTIVIRLFRQHAPKTTGNFIDLCQQGFYNNLRFHRVEPGFVVQTGCPNGNGTGGYVDPLTGQERRIGLELNPRLRHNAAGVVAMARTGNDPHSASSQFYITLSPQQRLDNKYAVFGGVVQGMDVVSRLTPSDGIIVARVVEPE